MVKEPEILEDYLEGYRAWRVVDNRLYSLLKSGEYPRGVAVAECNAIDYGGFLKKPRQTLIDHEAPDKNCKCGLYATWSKNTAVTSELIGVAGKVKGWGKSFMASGGWRSQYQMIEYLYNPLCQACCAEYRYDIRDAHTIFQASRKIKFDIKYALTTDMPDMLVDPEHAILDLNEYVCNSHLEEVTSGKESLLHMMLLGKESPFRLTMESIDVKRVVTDNKYMKELKDLSNYYEVDFKEFNNEDK